MKRNESNEILSLFFFFCTFFHLTSRFDWSKNRNVRHMYVIHDCHFHFFPFSPFHFIWKSKSFFIQFANKKKDGKKMCGYFYLYFHPLTSIALDKMCDKLNCINLTVFASHRTTKGSPKYDEALQNSNNSISKWRICKRRENA